MRMVTYQDGTKMDIQLGYLDGLRKISRADSLPPGYDIGYKVLLDKDNIASAIKPPTYKAYILSRPTEAQYNARLETFWMDSTYVAKFLWRDDIMAAKTRLDNLATMISVSCWNGPLPWIAIGTGSREPTDEA